MILWIEENFLLKNSIDNRNSELGLSFKSKNEFLNLHMNNGRVIIETKVGYLLERVVGKFLNCNFFPRFLFFQLPFPSPCKPNLKFILKYFQSIKFASEIIQSMGSYFAFPLLRSTCQFEEVSKIPNIFNEIGLIQESLRFVQTFQRIFP